MTILAAKAARKDRPKNGRDTRFKPKNPGRPKGIVSRRAQAGQEAARALEVQAWDVLERLLSSSSWRARHESARLVLAYALGTPKATLEVSGGFGDLSRELAAALAEARLRRAALDATGPVAALSEAPEAIPALPAAEAPALETEVVKGRTEGEP